jgi:hypothetical protein
MSEEPGRPGLFPMFRELITIIAGVLIALGVDNWNDGRRDRALEAQYLTALEADLRSDSTVLEGTFLPMLARKDSALAAIAPVVRGAPLQGDTLAFLDEVGLGGLMGTKNLFVLTRRATYDELLATGDLSLLRSSELRVALVEHYLNLDVASARMLARIADYPLFVHKYYPAEMREHKTSADIRAFGVRRALQAFRSPEFQALMDQEINSMYFARSQMENATKETNVMLRRVEEARGEGGG